MTTQLLKALKATSSYDEQNIRAELKQALDRAPPLVIPFQFAAFGLAPRPQP